MSKTDPREKQASPGKLGQEAVTWAQTEGCAHARMEQMRGGGHWGYFRAAIDRNGSLVDGNTQGFVLNHNWYQCI